ncbi:CinA family protein [Niabella beijingensis]|uniref:CinA family protein n=1 Tax=Niabella beijingensis TaxID=2872700 RepID=UPI001CBF5740|nr:CinA family protein [Niabella beijingensis]MBZ4192577.1 CinA family protein [Niabella beijingensis]
MIKQHETVIETCSRLMAEQQLTMASAESATAGKLAYAFSQTEYSGTVLKGGLISYDAAIKEKILKVPVALVERYSPESKEVTREMALRIRALMKADISVAVTGLTTPGGSERPGKPVGTMFYCIEFKKNIIDRCKIFKGSADEIIDGTIEQIARTIIRMLRTSNNKREE